jgi:RNA polymerase sigma factor (sigma-70 family)
MASRPYGEVLRQIHRLFERGTSSGLSEWQLLDRYARRRDEAAFEALVARHGPMVLGVCRRVLDDPHAVEDAFQATFLVLVRKAGTLGQRDALGQWLYGVACRVALHARCASVRRRSRELPVDRVEIATSGDEPGQGELASILDEELCRLPAKYRAPIVLCHLEGLTHEEAALRLQWPIGSVKGRLARAKDLLRGRLTRRGVVPAALAAALGRAATAAAALTVPEPLRQATLQAALRWSAGHAASGVVATPAVHLMEGVLATMFVSKLKVTAAAIGACGLLAFSAWGLAQSPRGERSGSQPAQRAAGGVEPWRGMLEGPIELKLDNARLEDLLKAIKKKTQTPGDAGMPIYVEPEGLAEAGARLDSPVTIDATKRPLKNALDAALRPIKLGAAVRDGLLVVTSRPEVALIELRALNEQLSGMSPAPQGPPAPAGADGASPAAWLKRMRGHKTIYSENSDDEANPEDEAKTRAVLEALKKPVPIPFANDSPLETVIGYVRDQTQSRELPDGIPIYVDPVGLSEAEKTMTSPVTLDVKGIALRETLRLMLKQLGLVYTVKDGLLSITSQSSEDRPTPILMLADKAVRGELSVSEMNELISMFKLREQIVGYESGTGKTGSVPSDSGSVGGVGGAIPAVEPPASPDVDAKTKLIHAALETDVTLQIHEMPLNDALAKIRELTRSTALPKGIQIYLNPRAVQGMAGGFNPANVTLDLADVKLKTALRLLLSQLGLEYAVEEGLLMIDREKPRKSGFQ